MLFLREQHKFVRNGMKGCYTYKRKKNVKRYLYHESITKLPLTLFMLFDKLP